VTFFIFLRTQNQNASFKFPFLKIRDVLEHLQLKELREVTLQAECFSPLIFSVVKCRILLPQIWFVGWIIVLLAATGQCDTEPPGFRVC
jgi:hypothetical protein